MSGFSNPIANAAGTLVRAVMKSVDFVAGVAGWQITRDGSAEFNDGTFRGAVTITAPVTISSAQGEIDLDPTTAKIKVIAKGNNSEIDIDPNNVNPQITFLSPDHTNNSFINAVSNNGNNTSDLGLNGGAYTPPDGTPRRTRLWFRDSQDAATLECFKAATQKTKGGYAQVTSTAVFVGYRDDDATINDFLTFQNTRGNASISLPLGLFNENWQPLTLFNGWTNFGGGFTPASFRLNASPIQSLQIAGVLTKGNTADGTVIAILPPAYCPQTTHRVQIAVDILGGTRTPTLDIQPNGNISILGCTATNHITFDNMISIDL